MATFFSSVFIFLLCLYLEKRAKGNATSTSPKDRHVFEHSYSNFGAGRQHWKNRDRGAPKVSRSCVPESDCVLNSELTLGGAHPFSDRY
ncbi:hypothetical protein K439DRAFT_1027132 [Ramaria rubella]|nr:hypothetical protein K439DRAFT_1027132 [Ramaria rubella]